MTDWPELPLERWRDTCETLHRWMQVVGKIQLELTPLVNHWWNVSLHVTSRGLSTWTIPYRDRWFTLEFDFLEDVLRLELSDGTVRTVALAPRTVADFYKETMSTLRANGIDVKIWPVPVEMENPIRLDRDDQHRSYDKEYVMRFWRIVALASGVFGEFRSRFIGKASPVHFFWGSFNLAVSRFSGRRAPAMDPSASIIDREAYSHEVSSVGWWPGDSRLERPTFYAYASPEPPGYRDAAIAVPRAYYHPTLRGFYLHYDDFLRSGDPEARLLEFCEATYEAAATVAHWDRTELERRPPTSPVEIGDSASAPMAT